MPVAVGVFLVAAMLVALAGAILTNVKLWGLLGESRRALRRLPPEKRKGVWFRLAVIYVVVGAEIAVVLAAPFEVRKTLTYFVILPFVVLLPVGIIAVGVRGFRGRRQQRRPSR